MSKRSSKAELLPAESHSQELPPDPGPVSILDRANPRSVLNLVSKEVSKLIEDAHFQAPHLFEMDEDTLFKTLKQENALPSAMENCLRQRFWLEYDACQAENRKHMTMASITGRFMTDQFFYAHFLTKPSRVAWMLCPPVDYLLKAEEALNFGLQQLRDILALEHVKMTEDHEGKKTVLKLDHELIKIKLNIYKQLEPRVKGAVLQKSVGVLAFTSNPQEAKKLEQALQKPCMEQMKARLEKLRRAERELGQGGVNGGAKAITEGS